MGIERQNGRRRQRSSEVVTGLPYLQIIKQGQHVIKTENDAL